jgi:hypothetical protein
MSEMRLGTRKLYITWSQRGKKANKPTNLGFPLQLLPQPIEIAVPPTYTGVFVAENGQICLHVTLEVKYLKGYLNNNFVVCVACASNTMRFRIDDIDFEEIGRRRVSLFQGLLAWCSHVSLKMHDTKVPEEVENGLSRICC